MTKRLPIRTPMAAAALAGCLVAAGCSSSKPASSSTSGVSTTSPASASAASSHIAVADVTTITIKNFAYTASGDATAGSTIKVINKDREVHTVTADTGKAFDVTVQPGQTVTFTAPTTAAKYKFHCSYHSNMHGILTVSN